MDWVAVTEAYVIEGFPSELEGQYEAWLVANPEKAGRLLSVTEGVVADFRQALTTDPVLVLDTDPEKVPEACIRHVLTIVYYNISLEMGLSINMSAQTAYSKAEIYLRQIYSGSVSLSGGESAPSPSYGTAKVRESTSLVGI